MIAIHVGAVIQAHAHEASTWRYMVLIGGLGFRV